MPAKHALAVDAEVMEIMEARAVIFQRPNALEMSWLELTEPTAVDAVVRVDFSGISAGTERLLWQGTMPAFPGMGYPLVPGYETTGTVISAPPGADLAAGDQVFVPGSDCFTGARGLFGGAASMLVVPASRLVRLDRIDQQEAVLLALAATAHHALKGGLLPELIIGHGVLGRLAARLVIALGGPPPVVLEANPARRSGAAGYSVIDADVDKRTDYRSIMDLSGDPQILDKLIARLAKGGEIVLAGFYRDRLSFAFPPAFMREARLRTAAEWRPEDMAAIQALLASDRFDLGGLISHRQPAAEAAAAYDQAFADDACLKMVLDWRGQA